MSHVEHKAKAPRAVRCCVITISDTRTEATDTSGRAIRELLEGVGHSMASHVIVKDDPDAIRRALDTAIADPAIQAVITTGGTGVTSRDGTFEVVTNVLQKRLDGFGELFRMLSWSEIGSSAMMSRATAGIAGGTAIFALPGSESAVRLAMTRLIVPELGHVVEQISR